MTQQASEFIGSIPEYYDKYLGPILFADFAEDLAKRLTQSELESVLELAAGTGIVSRIIRDALTVDCELVVTDLNEPMLDVAKKKFLGHEHVTCRQADALALPIGDSSFDRVVCQFGVMFFPDKLKSYQEVLRVLKPGGRYLFSVWDTWVYNPFAQLAHEAVAKYFPENPPGFYKVPFGYRDAEKIKSSLKDAGFSNVSHEVVKFDMEIPSVSDFARGLVFGNPLYDEIMNRKGDPAEIHLSVAKSIEANLGNNMPLQAIVFTAEKD
jgi:ubiquinone/menaquinone biosynthesis C-methylase UbiE